MDYRFVTDCVHSDGPSIDEMQDAATVISRRTFLKYAHRGDVTEQEKILGYDTGHERGGLRMASDWHVTYHRSVYQGRPCVFFCHSMIEYIFCPETGA